MSSVSWSLAWVCPSRTNSSTPTSSSSPWWPWSRSRERSRGSCSDRSSASGAHRASCGAWEAYGGARTPDRASTAWSPSCTAALPISFPDEDVLVAGRVAHPAAYTLFGVLDDVCPRPKYSPNGEERAWGRRLARRFGCDARYDDRSFRLSAHGAPELVLHAAAVKGGGKVVVELVGETDPANGEALIAYGWAMAEALADGLATPRS